MNRRIAGSYPLLFSILISSACYQVYDKMQVSRKARKRNGRPDVSGRHPTLRAALRYWAEIDELDANSGSPLYCLVVVCLLNDQKLRFAHLRALREIEDTSRPCYTSRYNK